MIGWVVGEHNLIFYAGDKKISERDHIWVQDALTVSVAMFQWMGLETNLDKNKSLLCTPG